jgi:hypothetical protein
MCIDSRCRDKLFVQLNSSRSFLRDLERTIPFVRLRFTPSRRQVEEASVVVMDTGDSKSDPKAESQEIEGKASSSGTTESNICVKSNEGVTMTVTVTGSLFVKRARLADRSNSRHSVAGECMLVTQHILRKFM